MTRSPEVIDAANRRLSAWLDTMKESPGKALAYDVARVWAAEGEEAAVTLFRAECKARKLVLWQQAAVANMVAAYRAKHALEQAEILK